MPCMYIKLCLGFEPAQNTHTQHSQLSTSKSGSLQPNNGLACFANGRPMWCALLSYSVGGLTVVQTLHCCTLHPAAGLHQKSLLNSTLQQSWKLGNQMLALTQLPHIPGPCSGLLHTCPERFCCHHLFVGNPIEKRFSNRKAIATQSQVPFTGG